MPVYNQYQTNHSTDIEQAFLNNTVLRNAEPNLVYGSDADKVQLPRNHGDTVRFYQYNKLPNINQPLQEGRPPEGQKMTRRTLEAKIKQYGAHIGMTDLLQAQLRDDPKRKAAELLGHQAGRSLDAMMREVYTSTTNRIIAGGKSSRSALTSADVLAVDDILEAMTRLDEAMGYRFGGDYHVITMPRGKLALQRDADWREVVDDSTHKNYKTGQLDKVYGAVFKISQQGKVIAPDKLTVSAYDASTKQVTFAEPVPDKVKDLYGDEIDNPLAAKLAAGKTVYFKGAPYTISSFTPSAAENTSNVVLGAALAQAAVAGDTLCTDDTTPDGLNVGVTIVYGQHAFGRVDLAGGGIQMIYHELGSAGTADPLDMLATSAWKVPGFAAKMLENDWCVAIEHAI